MKSVLLLLASTLSILQTVAWAGFSAQLEQTTITEGESVRLFLESDEQTSSQPDLSPLESAFEILGSSRSSRVSIINGNMSTTTSWTLTLSPKQPGTVDIPPLALNGSNSEPLTLQVNPASATSTTDDSPVFIEIEIDQDRPYLQQMVHYTARLYYQSRLTEGNLSDPVAANALIRRLGKDREYSTEKSGRRYQIIERHYALFPQQSGPLEVKPPILNAQVVIPAASRPGNSPLDRFLNNSRLSATKPIRIRGETITLEVRPIPDMMVGKEWIPAQGLILEEQWQPELTEIDVGVPLNRTITIEAHGLDGTQLPDLTPPQSPDINIYPDPSTSETLLHEAQLIGRKVRQLAYIPTRVGTHTLPPVRLVWWNTREHRMEETTLPERTIHVLPAADLQPPIPNTTGTANVQPIPSTTGPALQLQPTQSASVDTSHSPWLWSTLLFALLWLATLLFFGWKNSHNRSSPVASLTTTNPIPDCNTVKHQLLDACDVNDPHQARQLLIEWAACLYPENPPAGLDGIAQISGDHTLKKALQQLDQTLYHADNPPWDGHLLSTVLKQIPPIPPENQQRSPLPPLYPQ